MKNRITLLLFAALFLSVATLSAQSSFYGWGAGVHPSLYSFYAAKNGFFQPKNYEGGVQFSINKRLNNSFDLGLDLGFGIVRHPDLEADYLAGLRPRHRENFYEGALVAKYKFDNGYILSKESIIAPFLKAGFGGNNNTRNWHGHAPVGAGVNFRLNRIAADIVLQSTYNIGISGPSFLHHSLGLNINFARIHSKDKVMAKESSDRDYDGVPDDNDGCPDVFGTAKAKGCPDADGDGIKDTDDRCPDQFGYANLFGCMDSDHDGITDSEDECPMLYGESKNGCPASRASDKDADGVPDVDDMCPEVPGFFTAKGCPDADGDGIKDADDQCKNEYGLAEYKGCPIPADVRARQALNQGNPNNANNGGTKNGAPLVTEWAKANGGNIANVDPSLPDEEYCRRVSVTDLGRALFDSDVSSPQQNSYTGISKVVDVMKRCKNYNLVIMGHADSDGSAAYNVGLSQRRAEAVKKYLVNNGISTARLRTEAFGETSPMAPNKTEAGKQQNRRAEFKMNRGF